MAIRAYSSAPPPLALQSRFRPAPAPRPRRLIAPPFQRILCALDGSDGSAQALREAAALASPGAALDFVEVPHGDSTIDLLLAEARQHDLLAIAAGSAATRIAHRCEGPLLVVRPGPSGEGPASILLASDGSPGSRVAARTATRLAQASGSELRLLYVPDGMHPEYYREVLKQLTTIEKATGPQSVVVDDPGRVAERICEAAEAAHSSLTVLGHRGLSGGKALGSVSERVVGRAQTSVLLVPSEAPRFVA